MVCGHCGTILYGATITPVKCPKCGRPWKEKNPIRKVEGGWQWGYHGKVYPTREQTLTQMRAAYFAGYKGKNPTLVVPIKSKKQMEHLYRAQSQLSKAGVTFDTGTQLVKPVERHWELDWSLKGARIRNPNKTNSLLKFLGLYLVADGAYSYYIFRDQPIQNQLARIGRGLIGLYLLRRQI